jgi:uncharacterized membrane protein YfcA
MPTTSSSDAFTQALRPFATGNAPREVPAQSPRVVRRLVRNSVVGALGGLAGVAAMTATMEVYYRLLPADQRRPLGPSLIVQRVTPAAVRTGAHGERRHLLLTLAAHVGYGTTSGAAYALTMSKTPLPTPLKGLVFGLALFAVSYLGWLPSAGILRPASDYPAGRNAGLIIAHLIYGSVTALVAGALAHED